MTIVDVVMGDDFIKVFRGFHWHNNVVIQTTHTSMTMET